MAVDRNEMDEQLKKFESMIDKNDPEQVKLLDEMREHTKRLHQLRGDWNTPSNPRLWNDPTPPEKATPPLQIESYKAYKSHKLQIDKIQQLSLPSTQPILHLEAPPSPSS